MGRQAGSPVIRNMYKLAEEWLAFCRLVMIT